MQEGGVGHAQTCGHPESRSPHRNGAVSDRVRIAAHRPRSPPFRPAPQSCQAVRLPPGRSRYPNARPVWAVAVHRLPAGYRRASCLASLRRSPSSAVRRMLPPVRPSVNVGVGGAAPDANDPRPGALERHRATTRHSRCEQRASLLSLLNLIRHQAGGGYKRLIFSPLAEISDAAVLDTPTSGTGQHGLTAEPEAGNRTHTIERPTAMARPSVEQTHAKRGLTRPW